MSENKAMYITEIALMAFMADVKKLVADDIHRDVACCVLKAWSQKDKVSMMECGKEREKNLLCRLSQWQRKTLEAGSQIG